MAATKNKHQSQQAQLTPSTNTHPDLPPMYVPKENTSHPVFPIETEQSQGIDASKLPAARTANGGLPRSHLTPLVLPPSPLLWTPAPLPTAPGAYQGEKLRQKVQAGGRTERERDGREEERMKG